MTVEEQTPPQPGLSPDPATESQTVPEEAAATVEDAQDNGQDTESAQPDEGNDVAALQRRLDAANLQVEKYKEEILRQHAEQENLRKRMEREIEKAHKYALEKFAEALLPIKDSMEMGLNAAQQETADIQTLREGGVLIHNMMSAALEKFGILELNPLGEKFDPNLHEAITLAPAPQAEPNTVLVVHQKGFLLNERLLRPARVVVAKAL